MNRKQRRKHGWVKKQAEEMELNFKMVALAELWLQKPEAECFKNFKNIEKVKLLAAELEKVRKEGKIK